MRQQCPGDVGAIVFVDEHQVPIVHGQVATLGWDRIVGRQPPTALLRQQRVQDAVLSAVV